MNANIITTQIVHFMKYDLEVIEGNIRALVYHGNDERFFKTFILRLSDLIAT